MTEVIQAGEGYATDGEAHAAHVLSALPNGWIVIANKLIVQQDGQTREVDFIVIGDNAIFLLDEKSWGGIVTGNINAWIMRDGSSRRSPLDKVAMIAKRVAGILRSRIPELDAIKTPFVLSGVLLSGGMERPNIADPRAKDEIIPIADAVTILRRRDADVGGGRVKHYRPRIRQYFLDAPPRPKTPREIDQYTVEEDVSPPYSSPRMYRAHHANGSLRMLTLYPRQTSDPMLLPFYTRGSKALARLANTGTVPETYDSFTWSDDFIVVPSALPHGVALRTVPLADSDAEMRRIIASFEALQAIHAAAVIHRAITPDAIFIQNDGVQFSGFFAAKIDNASRSIVASLDDLGLDDPYAAPEIAILGYGAATVETDVYSLALVWLERLSGVPVTALRTHESTIAIPEIDEVWRGIPAPLVDRLLGFFRAALTPGIAAASGVPVVARPDAAACAATLREIVSGLEEASRFSEGNVLDKRYRVVRMLGEGTFAQTVLAEDIVAERRYALKRLKGPANSAARAEFNTLIQLPTSTHLPRVHEMYDVSYDFHIKMEYVPGETLETLAPAFVGDVARCARLVGNLLSALGVLEAGGLLHRDIKPANVILRAGTDEAVLVDFGVATPEGRAAGIAGSPRYMPPEAITSATPPPSCDRYAVAALTLELLTGKAFTRSPLPSVEEESEHLRPLMRALFAAVSPDPKRRYETAATFQRAVDAAMGVPEASHGALTTEPPAAANALADGVPNRPLEARVNPWVDNVRGLYRNSARGNMDNRGLDSDFARGTYVLTALDTRLLDEIFTAFPRVVFLSGNPGDGKTAFLERVRDTLRERGGTESSSDPSGWEWQLDGHTFRACYDASESHAGKSADEQLHARFAGLEGTAPQRQDLTVLVAINDGRLHAFTETQQATFGWITSETIRATTRGQTLSPGGVWLVDLKDRAFVSLLPTQADDSLLRRVLGTLTAADKWAVCTGCIAREICPIHTNARALGGADATNRRRLEHIFTLTHLRGQRHMTMRDLRSALAYLLTGDAGCEDVHRAREGGQPLPAMPYWQTAFTSDTDQDLTLGLFAPLDPARVAHPQLERYFFFRQSDEDRHARAAYFRNARDEPRGDRTAADWLAAVKRRGFFEGADGSTVESDDPPPVAWSTLLPYRHADRFINVLSTPESVSELLPEIARGISRSDGVAHTPDRALSLLVAHSAANRLTVLKVFPLDDFSLSAVGGHSSMVETMPSALRLTHGRTGARLLITLDLFEVLCRFAAGVRPDAPEFRPLLEDLAPFKNAVQRDATTVLMLEENGRQWHRIFQRAGTIVREEWRNA